MRNCNCPCTCPIEVGDRIQYKAPWTAGARLNGALDLTLAYLGTNHVIYTWKARDGRPGEGEGYMSRREFDERIEKVRT